MKLVNGEFHVQINGIKHWIKVDGSENNTIPLVLIHGGPGGNHYTFERTVGPFLSKFRTVVYYEQRGCGRTETPKSDNDYTMKLLIEDFIRLKRWLGVEKVDLLGYSFGGELALEFAYAIPAEINRIIVSGPSLMDSKLDKTVQISGFMSVANRDFQNKILAYQQKGLSIDVIYNKVWEMVDVETVDLLLFENQSFAKKNRDLWEESKLVNTGLMMKCLEQSSREVPLIDRLNDIKQMTLITTGVFDRNTGLPVSKIIHRHLPNSRLILFDNSAHFPDIEETNKFTKVIEEFLQ